MFFPLICFLNNHDFLIKEYKDIESSKITFYGGRYAGFYINNIRDCEFHLYYGAKYTTKLDDSRYALGFFSNNTLPSQLLAIGKPGSYCNFNLMTFDFTRITKERPCTQINVITNYLFRDINIENKFENETICTVIPGNLSYPRKLSATGNLKFENYFSVHEIKNEPLSLTLYDPNISLFAQIGPSNLSVSVAGRAYPTLNISYKLSEPEFRNDSVLIVMDTNEVIYKASTNKMLYNTFETEGSWEDPLLSTSNESNALKIALIVVIVVVFVVLVIVLVKFVYCSKGYTQEIQEEVDKNVQKYQDPFFRKAYKEGHVQEDDEEFFRQETAIDLRIDEPQLPTIIDDESESNNKDTKDSQNSQKDESSQDKSHQDESSQNSQKDESSQNSQKDESSQNKSRQDESPLISKSSKKDKSPRGEKSQAKDDLKLDMTLIEHESDSKPKSSPRSTSKHDSPKSSPRSTSKRDSPKSSPRSTSKRDSPKQSGKYKQQSKSKPQTNVSLSSDSYEFSDHESFSDVDL